MTGWQIWLKAQEAFSMGEGFFYAIEYYIAVGEAMMYFRVFRIESECLLEMFKARSARPLAKSVCARCRASIISLS